MLPTQLTIKQYTHFGRVIRETRIIDERNHGGNPIEEYFTVARLHDPLRKLLIEEHRCDTEEEAREWAEARKDDFEEDES